MNKFIIITLIIIFFLRQIIILNADDDTYINTSNITYDEKYQDYIKVKLESEKIFYKSGATCLRVTNIYGNGMSKDSIIFEILKPASPAP